MAATVFAAALLLLQPSPCPATGMGSDQTTGDLIEADTTDMATVAQDSTLTESSKSWPQNVQARLGELLENETALEKDRVDYAGALNEANILKNEIYKITNNTAKFEKEAYDTAVKFASICAVLIMAASFAYNLITWVLK